jgi:hypothetical protein
MTGGRAHGIARRKGDHKHVGILNRSEPFFFYFCSVLRILRADRFDLEIR